MLTDIEVMEHSIEQLRKAFKEKEKEFDKLLYEAIRGEKLI